MLNASFEPLGTVPTRRAVVLVLADKADSVHDTGLVLHAEHVALAVPSVVRLRQFVHTPHRRRVALSRRAVMARDGHRCQYCDGPAESIDHVTPKSRGGEHTWENVVACCRACNLRKGNRTPLESGFVLRVKPAPPRRFAWIYASTGFQVEPDWTPFLLPESA